MSTLTERALLLEWQSFCYDLDPVDLIEILGAKPKRVYEAILMAHPRLAPYVCTGKHWEWLQATDSEIMIDVLEALAKRDVVGLPLHDSVIAPARHTEQVKSMMMEYYRRRMGFEPYIR